MIHTESESSKYSAKWESLQSYQTPDWYRNAKFGIFVHWGVYSVPAFDNEWYPRNMYRRGSKAFQHHRQQWGPQSTFGYKDFIPRFTGAHWDPNKWMEVFKQSGARYVVPVAEHHDGFAMYATERSRWNAARLGPKRDIIQELATAARDADLKFGLSTHRAFNWRYYSYAPDFDTTDPAYVDLYNFPHHPSDPASRQFLADWFARIQELIDRFQPDLLYFDFGWHYPEFADYRPQILAYYYNRAQEWRKEVVLNYKDKLPDGVAVLDVERGKLASIRPDYWQTDTSVSYKSWGFVKDDEFRTSTSLVHDLVDIVSKNGNLLLNVGPRPDGTIPAEVVSLLQDVGAWLAANGEAIYATHPWETFGEGPTAVPTGAMSERSQPSFTARDIRYTERNNSVYAIVLGWPQGDLLLELLGSYSTIPAARIEDVRLLSTGQGLEWSQAQRGLTVSLPEDPPGDHAYVIKLTLKSDK